MVWVLIWQCQRLLRQILTTISSIHLSIYAVYNCFLPPNVQDQPTDPSNTLLFLLTNYRDRASNPPPLEHLNPSARKIAPQCPSSIRGYIIIEAPATAHSSPSMLAISHTRRRRDSRRQRTGRPSPPPPARGAPQQYSCQLQCAARRRDAFNLQRGVLSWVLAFFDDSWELHLFSIVSAFKWFDAFLLRNDSTVFFLALKKCLC